MRLGVWRVGRTHLHPDARGTLWHHRVAEADDLRRPLSLGLVPYESKSHRGLSIDASLQHLICHIRGEPGIPQHDRNDGATPPSGVPTTCMQVRFRRGQLGSGLMAAQLESSGSHRRAKLLDIGLGAANGGPRPRGDLQGNQVRLASIANY